MMSLGKGLNVLGSSFSEKEHFQAITETTDLGTEVWKSGFWILTAHLDSPYHCECVNIAYAAPWPVQR
jgi:hypothetical protein